jgi:hypothetical protein
MTIDSSHSVTWADCNQLDIVGATPHQTRWAINLRTDTGALVRIIVNAEEAAQLRKLLILKRP